MRLFLIAVVATLALTVAVPAQAAESAKARKINRHLRHKVIRLHGARAPGCDLVERKCRAHPNPSSRQIHRYLDTLRRMVMPVRAVRYVTVGRPYQQPAGTETVHAGGALQAIAQCESGGDYSTNTGNGFYGAYQFDLQTWQSVGGTGLPSSASPAEQDKRAAILRSQRGTAPWPVCGR